MHKLVLYSEFVVKVMKHLQEWKPGTLVLPRNSARDGRKGDKFQARYLGPYRVAENLGKGVYRLHNHTNGRILKKTVNACRLKLYRIAKKLPECKNKILKVGEYQVAIWQYVGTCITSPFHHWQKRKRPRRLDSDSSLEDCSYKKQHKADCDSDVDVTLPPPPISLLQLSSPNSHISNRTLWSEVQILQYVEIQE